MSLDMHRTILGLISFCFLAFPSTLCADVYKCKGTWTNKPCEDKPQAVITESEVAISHPSALDEERSEKFSLLHDLRMTRLKAKQKFGVIVDIKEAETGCTRQSTSLAECREIIDRLEEKIIERMNQADALSNQKKANQLTREANEIERRKAEAQTNIIINNNSGFLVTPTPDYLYIPGHSSSFKIKSGETELSITEKSPTLIRPLGQPNPAPTVQARPTMKPGFRPQNRFQVPR